jgi:glycosyltransferase involved in cell wall biosynthesis
MENSELAILIPVFNRMELLDRTLASIAANDERATVVVVDDASCPPLMAQSLAYTGPLVLLTHTTNKGIVSALNTGLEYILNGSFKYVARIDAGDVALTGRLRRQLEFLSSHPTYGLVGSRVREIGGKSEWLDDAKSELLKRRLHIRSEFAHPAVMIPVAVLRRVGCYRQTFWGDMEDWDLWFRIAKFYELKNLPEVLTELDGTPGSISRDIVYRTRVRRRYLKLMVLLWHFDCRCQESYIGLAKALGVLIINILLPPKIILARGIGIRSRGTATNQARM